MKLLIFKTNIGNRFKAKKVNSIFAYSPKIFEWSIDMEDIDNVLRVEADDRSSEKEIIEMVSTCGLQCEVLPD
ncbi:hypothetical protein [Roseivirga sp. E12]|uniref:hypothetical protein n=1 Tax=Roseivirga sp. E12 TaxID=2819237 RepID=UPI001ABC2588|nr:hypothetical protein [Roseivirga sp. E12]MBO3697939.1 hypothetical protein [Roseivirga sp. E12]